MTAPGADWVHAVGCWLDANNEHEGAKAELTRARARWQDAEKGLREWHERIAEATPAKSTWCFRCDKHDVVVERPGDNAYVCIDVVPVVRA